MLKSSVYLTEELKQSLTNLAGRSGRSEADLIRTAIEQLVRVPESPPTPTLRDPSFPRPAVFGVGMGPGDPTLATTAARRCIEAADRVLVLTADTYSVGRAEMVVRALAPSAPLRRIPFAIAGDDAARLASLTEVRDALLAGSDAGELTVVALLGDPSGWTVFPQLAAMVRRERPGLHVEAIPAPTTYQLLSARMGMGLGGPETPLVVVSTLDQLDHYLADPRADVVLYKATTDITAVQALARRHRRRAIVGELAGLPGERHLELADLSAGPLSYLAITIFPAEEAPNLPARKEPA